MAWHQYQADLYRAAGLTVHELPNWQTTGATRFLGTGDVWHSTVTPADRDDDAIAWLLRRGHSTLNGPLSQRGTARDGAVWLVAAGRCNHNGYGAGGNDMFGNEFFNDGYGEQFTAAQMWSGLVQSAALCIYNRWAATRVLGHKETDSDRKIDPRNVWMPGVRSDVQNFITHGLPTGDDMSAEAERMIRELHSTFHGSQGNNGPNDPTSRVLKVLDNAMWTSERIKVATDEARAAKTLAASCDQRLQRVEELIGPDGALQERLAAILEAVKPTT